MTACVCGGPLTVRPDGRAGLVCPAGHAVVPFLPPPRWKPGRCPDSAHSKRLMCPLDEHGQTVRPADPAQHRRWWCPGNDREPAHYAIVDRPNTVKHLSPSSLATARQCLRRFHAEYVLRRKPPSKLEAVRGVFAHRILELLAGEPDGQRDPDRARKIGNAEWPAHTAGGDFQQLRLTRDQARDYAHWAMAAVDRALEMHPLNGRRIIAAEHRFNRHIAGVEVHGVMDLVVEPNKGPFKVGVTDWKGLALDTPLPTPTGWTTMGEVQPGDWLLGVDGQPTRVVVKSQIHHRPCYRIEFGDGSHVVADNEHLWSVDKDNWTTTKVLTTEEVHVFLARGNQLHIRPPAPVELPDANLPIDPYVLGLWLGDGASRSGQITVGRSDLDATLDELEKRGETGCVARLERTAYTVTVKRPDRDACSRGHAEGRGGCSNCEADRYRGTLGAEHNLALTTRLRRAGLLCRGGEKRIPTGYLRASVAQRMELLRGLMDSDGSWNRVRDQAVFEVATKPLADGVAELVALMGWRTARWTDGYRFRVAFRPAAPHNPFSLPRKAALVGFANASGRSTNRTLRRAVPVPTVPTQCVMVDAADSLYLCGERMVPTHNTGKPADRNYPDRVAEKMVQPHIYNAAAKADFNVERQQDVCGQLVFIGEQPARMVAHPSDTGRVVRTVRDTWAQVQAAQDDKWWPANPGPLCGWCEQAVWRQPDGTIDFCPEGMRYAFSKMDGPYGWTKRGSSEPTPTAVTINALTVDERRQARQAAESLTPPVRPPDPLRDGEEPF